MSDLTIIPGGGSPDEPGEEWESALDESSAEFQGRASTGGREFKHRVEDFLAGLGVQIDGYSRRVAAYTIDFEITGPNGAQFSVIAHGTFDDDSKSGLRRTDTVKKMGFDAHQIRRRMPKRRLIAIVSHLPNPGNAAAQLADTADDLFDVIAMTGDVRGIERLHRYLHEEPFPGQLPAPWRDDTSEFTEGLFDAIDDVEED